MVSRGDLDQPVLDMVRDLSARHGRSWATERGFREELARRTGRASVGKRSIGRTLGRLAARGVIEHERVLPGGRMANGQRTSVGTTHNRIVARAERRRRKLRAARVAKARTARELAAAKAADEARDRQRVADEQRAAAAKLDAERATPDQVKAALASLAFLREPDPPPDKT